MATQFVSISEFYGIDQSGDGNTRNQGTSPDAQNFDTRDGNLTVSEGYVKHILTKVPCDIVRRVFIFKGLTTNTFIVIGETADKVNIYAYNPAVPEWTSIYEYVSTVKGLKWDSLQCNIGNNDYIIFACGESQLVKWDGTIGNNAELFGSGDYLLETTVASYASATKTVTLTDAITDTVKARILQVGIVINDVTLAAKSVDIETKKVVLTNAPASNPSANQTAKVRGSISNAPVNFIVMHYSRLFAAGDPANPTRLYYSQIPGDGRTIEDWSVDEASANTSGGFVEVGDSFGDPIVGLASLSNQLIIFKRYSVYRLIGSKPSTFTIQKLDAEVEKISHSSITMHGDVPYYMTPAGMFYFNGQTVISMADARKIQTFMQTAYIELSKGAENKDILYFTCYEGSSPTTRDYDNAIIVYDLYRKSYMIRRGFEVADIISHDGTLYMVNGEGYVYRMNEGKTYDGLPINAYWNTPLTDINRKAQNKTVKEVYLRAVGDAGSSIQITTSGRTEGRYAPENVEDVLEIIPSADKSRTVQFKIANEAGGWFSIRGGFDFYMEVSERTR